MIGMVGRSGYFLLNARNMQDAMRALQAKHAWLFLGSAGKGTAWNGTECYGSVIPITCQAIRLGNRAFQLSHKSTLQTPETAEIA